MRLGRARRVARNPLKGLGTCWNLVKEQCPFDSLLSQVKTKVLAGKSVFRELPLPPSAVMQPNVCGCFTMLAKWSASRFFWFGSLSGFAEVAFFRLMAAHLRTGPTAPFRFAG